MKYVWLCIRNAVLWMEGSAAPTLTGCKLEQISSPLCGLACLSRTKRWKEATRAFCWGLAFTLLLLLSLSWMTAPKTLKRNHLCLANGHGNEQHCWGIPGDPTFAVITIYGLSLFGAKSGPEPLRGQAHSRDHTSFTRPILTSLPRRFLGLPKQVQSRGQFSPYSRVTLPTVYTGPDMTT